MLLTKISMASLPSDTLYLDFQGSTCDVVQSHAAFFLVRFTNSTSFNFVKVGRDARTIDQNGTTEETRRDGADSFAEVFQKFQSMSLDGNNLGKVHDLRASPVMARMIEPESSQTDIPDAVRGCRLPVILNAAGDICHCGLSTVIRKIVLSSAKEEGSEQLADLLGFRQTSLKNCAEASFWTKLVDSALSEDLSALYRDHLKGTTIEPTDALPDSLTLFEEKLASPVSTFNIHHQKSGDLGASSTNGKGSRKGKMVKGTVSDYKTDKIVVNKKAYKEAVRSYKLALSSGGIPPTTRFKDSAFFISLDNWRDRMKQAELETIQLPSPEQHRTDLDESKYSSKVTPPRNDGVAQVSRTSDVMSSNSVPNGTSTAHEMVEGSHGKHSCKNFKNQPSIPSSDVCEENVEFLSTDDSNQVDCEGHVDGCLGSRDGGSSNNSISRNQECHIEETKAGPLQAERKGAVESENCDNSGNGMIGNTTLERNEAEIVGNEVPVEPSLKHLFAEGPFMTITDLAVFIPVHLCLWLCKDRPELPNMIPHTLNWYRRMWSLREVSEAALLYGLEMVQFKRGTSGVSVADVKILPPVDYQHGKGKSRKARNHAIKRELPGVLAKVESSIGLPIPEDRAFKALDWSALPAAVSPQHGEVPQERLLKKHQQIECLVSMVRALAQDGDTIVDFCSGGGHVGIVLAFLLPRCNIYMIENNEESLRRACQRVRALGLENVVLYQSNIGYFRKTFNIGVSLHACGGATDIVIDKCLENRASLVSSPCCYGAISPTDSIPYPRSERFRKISVTAQEYLVVAHAAEQTNWDFSHENSKRGKLCMSVIDEDRSSYIREHGYRVHLCSLQPMTCSPKNNLLIGIPPDTVDQ